MVWFSGSANSTMSVAFGADIPLLPWQRKFALFNTEFAITQLVQEIRPICLHLLGGFRDRVYRRCQPNFTQATPVDMVTKNWKFLPENLSTSVVSQAEQ